MLGGAADFKYLIRVPKQEMEEQFESNNGEGAATDKKSLDDTYFQDTENMSDDDLEADSDDDEEIVILRCETTMCHDGKKCIPEQFDFVVRVRYAFEDDAPQAADTFFPHVMPYKIDKGSCEDYLVSNTSRENIDPS